MQNVSHLPAGTTITRVYWSIPGHYGVGQDFEDRDAAVTAVQRKHAARVQALQDSLGAHAADASIRAQADRTVVLDLRWEVTYPSADGSPFKEDFVAERFTDVMRLRTSRR